MLGKSTDLIIYAIISCLVFCSLILCSAGSDIPNARDHLRRVHRSEHTGAVQVHKADPKAVVSDKQPANDKNHKNNTVSTIVPLVNNVTGPEDLGGESTVGRPQRNLNSGALLRGFSVFVGLSAIVVIYFVIRAISMRRKKTTVRKYGILTNREDVEMTPLGAEDDEEDTTLFDVSNQTRP